MAAIQVVDLCNDDDNDEGKRHVFKADRSIIANAQNVTNEGLVIERQRSQTAQVSEENKSSSALSTTCHSYSGVMEQALLHAQPTHFINTSPPISRNFWKAGNYHNNGLASNATFLSN